MRQLELKAPTKGVYLRIDSELMKQVKIEAAKQGITVTHIVESLLEKFVKNPKVIK